MDKFNVSTSGSSSAEDSHILKAGLEGRITQICQYIETRRSYIDFIGDHIDSRVNGYKKLNKLCEDYQLYSPNLDGSVQEILEKVEEIADHDSDFFAQISKREKEEVNTLVTQCREIFEMLIKLRRKEAA